MEDDNFTCAMHYIILIVICTRRRAMRSLTTTCTGYLHHVKTKNNYKYAYYKFGVPREPKAYLINIVLLFFFGANDRTGKTKSW